MQPDDSNWFVEILLGLLSNPVLWVVVVLWLIMLAFGRLEAP